MSRFSSDYGISYYSNDTNAMFFLSKYHWRDYAPLCRSSFHSHAFNLNRTQQNWEKKMRNTSFIVFRLRWFSIWSLTFVSFITTWLSIEHIDWSFAIEYRVESSLPFRRVRILAMQLTCERFIYKRYNESDVYCHLYIPFTLFDTIEKTLSKHILHSL